MESFQVIAGYVRQPQGRRFEGKKLWKSLNSMYESGKLTTSTFFFVPPPTGFTLLHLIATGVSCFLGAGLLSFLVYVYCQRFHKQSQESAVIHPTTPNHLNYKGNTTPKNEKYTPMEFKVGTPQLCRISHGVISSTIIIIIIIIIFNQGLLYMMMNLYTNSR